MTLVIENKESFLLVTRDLSFVEDDREMASAWSSKHIQKNPAIRWILGKYVEADRANANRQFWSLADLQMNIPSVNHAPLNILHRPKHIVGAFVATEIMYPVTDEAGTTQTPWVEALAAFWRYYFPEELAVLEAAHNAGTAAYSMECVADTMTCAGADGCGTTFPYKGPRHDTYCEHLNSGASIRQLDNPHFLAGALIFPPAKPGWGGASIQDISGATDPQFQEYVYAALQDEMPEGKASDWESLMAQVLLQFEESKKLKKTSKPKKDPQEIIKDAKKKMGIQY